MHTPIPTIGTTTTMPATNRATRTSRWSAHRVRRLLARGVLGLTALLLALAGTGLLYQRVSDSTFNRDIPPPGTLVDAGGIRLHLLTMGAHHQGPTVILEAGMAGMSSQWSWIQPEVARFARVVAYDRPGLGWSEADGQPYDARRGADQLHAALQMAGIGGPYLVVGHSSGGLLARIFAGRYPDEVAGVVLVDASHPDQAERFPTIRTEMAQFGKLYTALNWLAHVGGVRALGLTDAYAAGLPTRDGAITTHFFSAPAHLRATRAEFAAWEATTGYARTAGSLGGRPLVVLTAGASWATEFGALQAELATLSSQGVHRVVAGAEHMTIVTQQEHAEVVVAAIREVLADQPHD
jgi:pimeloyl-ACP methyl ester carboxylesterase